MKGTLLFMDEGGSIAMSNLNYKADKRLEEGETNFSFDQTLITAFLSAAPSFFNELKDTNKLKIKAIAIKPEKKKHLAY